MSQRVPGGHLRLIAAAGLLLAYFGQASFAEAAACRGSYPPLAPCLAPSSDDGSRAVFQTRERLAVEDDDDAVDVYLRSGGVTTLISVGTAGNGSADAFWKATSVDGSVVHFETEDSLTPDDDDTLTDVYRRSGGTTELVTGREPGGAVSAEPTDAQHSIASRDGSKLVFTSTDRLTSEDTDSFVDVYEHSTGQTRLLSVPAPGVGPDNDTFLIDISDDASHVILMSYGRLTGEDDDNQLPDLYEREGGVTRLITKPDPGMGAGPVSAAFGQVTADGSHVFFGTNARLVAEDVPDDDSLYVSGPSGLELVVRAEPGAGDPDSTRGNYLGSSADDSRVFFTTSASLVAEDTDHSTDVYERANDTTRLVTAAGAGGTGTTHDISAYFLSRDASTVVWQTPDRMVGADTDDAYDVYQRRNGQTTLVSAPANSGVGHLFSAFLGGISDDGATVAFQTGGELLPEDQDTDHLDIYGRSASGLFLASAPGTGASGPSKSSHYSGISGDGSHIFFSTEERLVADDADDDLDFYVRSSGGTELISAGPRVGDPVPPGGSQGGVAGEIAASPEVDVHRVYIPRSRRALIREGVRVLASCQVSCRLDLEVRMVGGLANRFGVSDKVVGRGSTVAPDGERRWVGARLNGRARRALTSGGRGARLKLRVTAEVSG